MKKTYSNPEPIYFGENYENTQAISNADNLLNGQKAILFFHSGDNVLILLS